MSEFYSELCIGFLARPKNLARAARILRLARRPLARARLFYPGLRIFQPGLNLLHMYV